MTILPCAEGVVQFLYFPLVVYLYIKLHMLSLMQRGIFSEFFKSEQKVKFERKQIETVLYQLIEYCFWLEPICPYKDQVMSQKPATLQHTFGQMMVSDKHSLITVGAHRLENYCSSANYVFLKSIIKYFKKQFVYPCLIKVRRPSSKGSRHGQKAAITIIASYINFRPRRPKGLSKVVASSQFSHGRRCVFRPQLLSTSIAVPAGPAADV